VKFLIDAQLPARLAEFLNRASHDAVHTIGMPEGNRSTDSQIAERADIDGRVVVTKDQDFRDGHLLSRSPRQLLVIATGNINNDALLSLFELHLDAIVSALGEADFRRAFPKGPGARSAQGGRRQLTPPGDRR
jgi:predicted nuclease of predicted toxin-antitoxin system